MIAKNFTMISSVIISLALTPIEQMEAAATAETRLMVVLTSFASLTLIISLILLFWVRARYRQIAKLTAANEELKQEISKLRSKNV